MTTDAQRRRVLLIPGGASPVHGYFPDLSSVIAHEATVMEADPPEIGNPGERRPLRFSTYAHGLAQAIRREGDGPVLLVGHSLGGLVALRLAVDEPDLVAAVLLLDPTPLTPPAALRTMAPFLKVLGWLGPVGRRMWTAQARRDVRGLAMSGEQQRALTVYTDSRFLAQNARWARHLARDGSALAKDIAAGKVRAIPTIVVSAGQRSPRSPIRHAHEQLVARIPGAQLEVWEGTTHPLHIQQPSKVADAVHALLGRT